MELKLSCVFKSLGIAISETVRLYEYKVVITKKGQKLYVKRLKPVFDNGIAELYRFKRGEKTFVFVIDKGKKYGCGRRLAFDNWPSGQSIFAMLMDDIIMVANRISDSTKIDCSDLHFIKIHPQNKFAKIQGPKTPVTTEQIIYESGVLSIGKNNYLPITSTDGKFSIHPISEWLAKDLRLKNFIRQDRAKWVPIPLLENYDL